ncbi:MAG: hypothetical protein ACFFBY_00535 [Promethearchaeota archaeon]
MLYFLFLYQSKSGALLYEKDFQTKSNRPMELFGSFYIALKTFISSVIPEQSQDIKTIGLGEINAYATTIPEYLIDIIIIADKEDYKIVEKLFSGLIKIILNYKTLFQKDSIDRTLYENFDEEINNLILSYKKIIDPMLLIEKQGDILKSIWTQKGKLSEKLREEIEEIKKKRENAIKEFEFENNIIKKLTICQEIIKFCEDLEDDQALVEYQKNAKLLKDEIYDNKLRLTYYLAQAKESLQSTLDTLSGRSIIYGQYKEVYSNLYSFSSKLKNFSNPEIQKKYYDIAKKFIDVNKISQEEFSEVISEVLNMEDDIEYYFSNYNIKSN